MAGSVNKCILIGNLGRDPEIRTTQAGKKIANLTLATSETWNDRASGERKEKTEWHRVSVFSERAADFLEKYAQKGSKLYVEGSLQTRKWQAEDGSDRFSTEVVVGDFNGRVDKLDSAPSQQSEGGGGQTRGNYTKPQGGGRGATQGPGDLDDKIPFSTCWQ